MSTALDVAKIAIPTAATLLGFYFAYGFHRHIRQHVMERRVEAYAAFWPVMRPAASIRLRGDWAGGPLSERERADLFKATTDWFYGQGLFLSDDARRVYLKAKENLICPVDEIEPESVRRRISSSDDVDAARGRMTIRQFSLVRWVMRFDLALETEPYFATLTEEDRAFLESCDINLDERPWRDWATVEDSAGTVVGV